MKRFAIKWTVTVLMCVAVVAAVAFAMLRMQAASERSDRIGRGVILLTD